LKGFKGTPNFPYKGAEALRAQTIISAPINVVWASMYDFFDMTWHRDDLTLTKVNNYTRSIVDAQREHHEIRLDYHQSPDLCYYIFKVKLMWSHNKDWELFMRSMNSVVNTTMLSKIDEERTLYTELAHIDGPFNKITDKYGFLSTAY